MRVGLEDPLRIRNAHAASSLMASSFAAFAEIPKWCCIGSVSWDPMRKAGSRLLMGSWGGMYPIRAPRRRLRSFGVIPQQIRSRETQRPRSHFGLTGQEPQDREGSL